jgi:hypothetical protein
MEMPQLAAVSTRHASIDNLVDERRKYEVAVLKSYTNKGHTCAVNQVFCRRFGDLMITESSKNMAKTFWLADKKGSTMPPSYAAGGVASAGTRSSAGNGATIVAAKYIGYLILISGAPCAKANNTNMPLFLHACVP